MSEIKLESSQMSKIFIVATVKVLCSWENNTVKTGHNLRETVPYHKHLTSNSTGFYNQTYSFISVFFFEVKTKTTVQT